MFAIQVVMVQNTLTIMAVVLGEGENIYCGGEVMKIMWWGGDDGESLYCGVGNLVMKTEHLS